MRDIDIWSCISCLKPVVFKLRNTVFKFTYYLTHLFLFETRIFHQFLFLIKFSDRIIIIFMIRFPSFKIQFLSKRLINFSLPLFICAN